MRSIFFVFMFCLSVLQRFVFVDACCNDHTAATTAIFQTHAALHRIHPKHLIKMIFRTAVFVCAVSCVSAWVSSPISSAAVKVSQSQIMMGGGKSQSEKLLTKKQIFRDLRGKLDTAAKIPGFFDVGQKVVRPSIDELCAEVLVKLKIVRQRITYLMPSSPSFFSACINNYCSAIVSVCNQRKSNSTVQVTLMESSSVTALSPNSFRSVKISYVLLVASMIYLMLSFIKNASMVVLLSHCSAQFHFISCSWCC